MTFLLSEKKRIELQSSVTEQSNHFGANNAITDFDIGKIHFCFCTQSAYPIYFHVFVQHLQHRKKSIQENEKKQSFGWFSVLLFWSVL